VSASFLSQLETGKAQPSVATLYSICGALDLSVDDLFASEPVIIEDPVAVASSTSVGAVFGGVHLEEERSRVPVRRLESGRSPVVRPAERQVINLDSGVTWERLTATTGKESNFLFVRYEVGGSSTDGNLIRHVGTEYWYVMRGVLDVVLGFETYRLNAGDAVSFSSTTPHRLVNSGSETVEAIWFDLEHHSSTAL
jgi:mannose-6-phosphate isomerase-like protein (cupin superfamily)/DNA-binding XRE family transcriptional regulator